jgi:hypothetical protein
VVRANRFIIEDETGKVRAVLGVTDDEAGLILIDESDKTRAALSVGKDGPGLALHDENGKVIWSQP